MKGDRESRLRLSILTPSKLKTPENTRKFIGVRLTLWTLIQRGGDISQTPKESSRSQRVQLWGRRDAEEDLQIFLDAVGAGCLKIPHHVCQED